MSKYKMGDVFDLPIFNNSHTYGSGLSISVISDNYCNDVISGESDLTNNEVDCICEAVNNYDKNQDRINELEKAILETLDEHGDLADGDVCTLIKLKRVMGL